MSEIEKLQFEIGELRRLVETLIFADKIAIQKLVKVNDGRNIVVGKTTGTKIGTESTQKLAFYGATPVVRANAITAPSGGGSGDTDAIDISARAAINSLLTALGKTSGVGIINN